MSRVLTRRRLVLLAVLGVLLLLPWWFARQPPPVVDVIGVELGPLEVKVATNGKIEPLPDAELEVRARVEGRIVSILDAGTTVLEGAELLRIEQDAVAADLAAARSERLAATEALRQARHELSVATERFTTDRKLYEEGALTRDRYAESESALRDAEARVRSLEKEVPLRTSALDLRIGELETQLESTVVRAPFSGTVYRTAAKKGEVVRVGEPILWLADLEHLRVRANIDQVDLGRVKKGQQVLVGSNAYPDRTWTGHITEVVPHVFFRENRSISEGLADLDPPTDGLVPGMTVDVEIVVAHERDARQVPAEAIFKSENEPFVYRLDGKRIRRTPVEIGLSGEGSVQILTGVEPGDRVVIGPKPGLRDGMRVRVDSETGGAVGKPSGSGAG